jgi:predicted RNA-binding protein
MCLSSVYKLREGKKELIQGEVARMEERGDGYVLYGILGERGSVRGRIVNVDFMDAHEVVLEEEPESEAGQLSDSGPQR